MQCTTPSGMDVIDVNGVESVEVGDDCCECNGSGENTCQIGIVNYFQTRLNLKFSFTESMESGIASQSSSSEGGGGGGGGSSASCHHHHPANYSVDSVMDLMYQEFAILTGAKSLDDHYILMFPDRGNFHFLADEDYKRLMIYLTAVPP